MTRRNYAEEDEEDFYGQNFEEDGVVSLWVGKQRPEDQEDEINILHDWCGVGAYDVDFCETMYEANMAPIGELVRQLSYSATFELEANKAARERGQTEARWIAAQYDFRYAPERIKRPINPDVIFLGVFRYSKNQ